MSEINERASANVDCPTSPLSVSDEARRLSDDVFQKVSTVVRGQVQSTVNDYKQIEDMNQTTAQLYRDMSNVAETVSVRLAELEEKYETFQPYLQQINEIEAASKRLEAVANTLVQYANAIEANAMRMLKPHPERST